MIGCRVFGILDPAVRKFLLISQKNFTTQFFLIFFYQGTFLTEGFCFHQAVEQPVLLGQVT